VPRRLLDVLVGCLEGWRSSGRPGRVAPPTGLGNAAVGDLSHQVVLEIISLGLTGRRVAGAQESRRSSRASPEESARVML
jgi:hypothetical protein